MPRKLTQEEVLEKFVNIHGNRFDYSKMNYINATTKVDVRCIEHDTWFKQNVGHHFNGNVSCPVCKKQNTTCSDKSDDVIKSFVAIYGDRFDYSQAVYVDSSSNIKIRCIEHDTWFKQNPRSHKKGYNGCPICKTNHKKSDVYSDTKEDFVKKARDVHGDRYDYSETKYIRSQNEVKIRCIKHNELFEQLPATHVQGYNKCSLCYKETMRSSFGKTQDDFISDSVKEHGDKYDYSEVEYINSTTPVKILCKKEGHPPFYINPGRHLHGKPGKTGNGCPMCGNENQFGPSNKEKELLDFVKELDKDIIGSDRTMIYPKELDIVSHKHKMAIEFDGLFWHSSGSGDMDKEKRGYHIDKTLGVEEQGYMLFHIFENEWDTKRDIVKSMIRSKMGYTDRIYARKCEVVYLDGKESKKFFDENHIQGNCRSKNTIALKFDGVVVCAMSFGENRYGKKADYELLRFCNKIGYTIVGGASRLFKNYVKDNPGKYVSYANRRWSVGNMYEKLGFTFSHNSEPCYWYIKNAEMWHRSSFMKHKLKDKLKEFNPDLTEVENMYNSKYRRIWDCGNKVYYYES